MGSPSGPRGALSDGLMYKFGIKMVELRWGRL